MPPTTGRCVAVVAVVAAKAVWEDLPTVCIATVELMTVDLGLQANQSLLRSQLQKKLLIRHLLAPPKLRPRRCPGT